MHGCVSSLPNALHILIPHLRSELKPAVSVPQYRSAHLPGRSCEQLSHALLSVTRSAYNARNPIDLTCANGSSKVHYPTNWTGQGFELRTRKRRRTPIQITFYVIAAVKQSCPTFELEAAEINDECGIPGAEKGEITKTRIQSRPLNLSYRSYGVVLKTSEYASLSLSEMQK